MIPENIFYWTNASGKSRDVALLHWLEQGRKITDLYRVVLWDDHTERYIAPNYAWTSDVEWFARHQQWPTPERGRYRDMKRTVTRSEQPVTAYIPKNLRADPSQKYGATGEIAVSYLVVIDGEWLEPVKHFNPETRSEYWTTTVHPKRWQYRVSTINQQEADKIADGWRRDIDKAIEQGRRTLTPRAAEVFGVTDVSQTLTPFARSVASHLGVSLNG